MKNVSLPTNRECNSYPFPLTDYARASLGDFTRDPQDTYAQGFWVRNEENNELYMPTPRFDEAFTERKDMSIVVFNRQKNLHVNRKQVLYPQTRVDEALETELEAAFINDDPALKKVGNFLRPVADADLARQQNEYKMKEDPCFEYQNHNYVVLVDHKGQSGWFKCEPVQVLRNVNNGIQCNHVLVVPPYYYMSHLGYYTEAHVDMNVFEKYLNRELIQNLETGTKLNQKLAHVKSGLFRESVQMNREMTQN